MLGVQMFALLVLPWRLWANMANTFLRSTSSSFYDCSCITKVGKTEPQIIVVVAIFQPFWFRHPYTLGGWVVIFFHINMKMFFTGV